MMLTSGFFNSKNSDRLYDAEQISSLFDGLINDGVYETVGDRFRVTPAEGMQVYVGTGRAWFNHTWTENTTRITRDLQPAPVNLNRIDLIVLEVNHNEDVRENSIKVLTGTPAMTPSRPTLTKTDYVKQYPLAEIYIDAGVTSIAESKLKNCVGTSECPFVIGVVAVMTTDQILGQWRAEWQDITEEQETEFSVRMTSNETEYRSFMTDSNTEYRDFMSESDSEFRQMITDDISEFRAWFDPFTTESESEFEEWFSHIVGELDGDLAGHLQLEIDAIRPMTNDEIDAVWNSVFGY